MRNKSNSTNPISGIKVAPISDNQFSELQYELAAILRNPKMSRPTQYEKLNNVFQKNLSVNSLMIEDCRRLSQYVQELSGAFDQNVSLIRMSKSPTELKRDELQNLLGNKPGYALVESKNGPMLYYIKPDFTFEKLKVKNIKEINCFFPATSDKSKMATKHNLDKILSQTGKDHLKENVQAKNRHAATDEEREIQALRETLKKATQKGQSQQNFKNKWSNFKHSFLNSMNITEEYAKKFEDPYKAACRLLLDKTISVIRRDIETQIQKSGKKLYETDKFNNDLGTTRYNGWVDFALQHREYKDILTELYDGLETVLDEKEQAELYDKFRRKTTNEEVEEYCQKMQEVQDYEKEMSESVRDAFSNLPSIYSPFTKSK